MLIRFTILLLSFCFVADYNKIATKVMNNYKLSIRKLKKYAQKR